MYRILILEDDEALRMGLAFQLKREGFQVLDASRVAQVEEELKKGVDLMLLDVSLPDGDSRQYVEHLRQKSRIPVIFLTARNREADMLSGFDAGADDYVTKPFSFPVLNRRIWALLRRSESGDRYYCEDLVYDFQKKELKIKGEKIPLSNRETRILEIFIRNKNQVLTFDTLLEKVWDIDGNFVDRNTLNVNIARLRGKIEEDKKNPRWIVNIFGIGYKWSEEHE
ncbi:MAG: response regulator transcription factor [Blautia sp.]|jgi:DNA-binding response OmpR family regulator